jgi:FtsH-binding integral membrane protein
MEQGWDPEVKRYFRKIINSFSYGLLWMIAVSTAGIYFKLGMADERPLYAVILFYVLAVAGLALLLRYYYKVWGK